MPLFHSRIPPRTAHNIWSSCLLRSSWLGQFQRLSLVFEDCPGLKSTGQIFCRMSLNWNLSDAFCIIRLGLWVWGKKSTEVSVFSSHQTKGTCYQCDQSLLMLTSITSVCHIFPLTKTKTKKLLFSPHFPHYPLWKEATMCSPHLRGWGVKRPAWTQSTDINHLEFFWKGDLSILPHLFMYSVICLWTNGYLYGPVDIYFLYPILLYFIAQKRSSLGHEELFQLAPESLCHPCINTCTHARACVCVWCVCLSF